MTKQFRLKLVTSCWSRQLPPHIAAIGVSRGPPRGRRGYKVIRELAPGSWFSSTTEPEFIALYYRQLASLDAAAVYRRIAALAAPFDTAALLCFERPGTRDGWCHRAMISKWFSDCLGLDVAEYGYELLGCSDHPLSPATALPSFRR